MHKIMYKLAQKHGDVMSFWFGNKYTVVVSHYKYFHEALKKKGKKVVHFSSPPQKFGNKTLSDHTGEAFAGRFLPQSMNIITRGQGVALQGDLTRWRKARTVLLNGMTKKQQGERQVPVIAEEVQSTVVEFCKLYKEKKAIPFRLHMKRESINVVMRLCCDFRFSSKLTPMFDEIQSAIATIFECISAGNPSDYIPLARLGGEPAVVKRLKAATAKRDKYIREWVSEHKRTLDESQPRDFLDIMLIEQDKVGLTDSDIEVIIWDIMAGGIDTYALFFLVVTLKNIARTHAHTHTYSNRSATSIEWLIYLLIKHPEVQKKAHEELDRVVGSNKLPTYVLYFCSLNLTSSTRTNSLSLIHSFTELTRATFVLQNTHSLQTQVRGHQKRQTSLHQRNRSGTFPFQTLCTVWYSSSHHERYDIGWIQHSEEYTSDVQLSRTPLGSEMVEES